MSCSAVALVRDQAGKKESQLLGITLPGVDFKGGDLRGVGPVHVTSPKVRGSGKLSEKWALGLLGPVVGRRAQHHILLGFYSLTRVRTTKTLCVKHQTLV